MFPAKPAAKIFDAPLQRTGDRLNWVVIRVPFDAAKLWGKRGQIKVKGEIRAAGPSRRAGFAFRTSLFPDGKGNHFMMVNKQMQAGAGVRPGMTASFRMEPDAEERAVTEPGELVRALRQSKALRRFYESLNYSTRREIAKWITAAKQKQTRMRRSEQMAERLMETLEAERELPPLLKVALTLNPKARAGWQRMPPSHRRAHLLGIFYYRNPESRARRVAKAVAMMEEYAEKGAE
ncbi:MAG: YdeI/OmpD-associated family protein [Terriglobales bacterium]